MGVSEYRLGIIYDIKKSLLILLGLIIVLLYYGYICGHVRKKSYTFEVEMKFTLKIL